MAPAAALDLVEPFHRSRAHRTRARIRSRQELKIARAFPVVRRAMFMRHVPILTTAQTRHAHALFEKAWPEWKELYRRKVAAVARVAEQDLYFDKDAEVVRWRRDGKTPMIDLPRLRTTPQSSKQFDQRNCVALCVHKFSSKVWTRLGLPEGNSGCVHDEIGSLTQMFRAQTEGCGGWFYDEFFRITTEAFKRNTATRLENLEITTIGLEAAGRHDEYDLAAWLFKDESPNLANEQLCSVLAAAAHVRFDISNIDLIEPDSFWFSIPNAVQLADGRLVPRRVLYLARPISGGTQVVGVGFDSGSGDLANDVALKISRLIANRI
jgi:hypothetical protein